MNLVFISLITLNKFDKDSWGSKVFKVSKYYKESKYFLVVLKWLRIDFEVDFNYLEVA